MFKQPLHTYKFFNSDQVLPGVNKFTGNLVHLPCHHFLQEEELIRIRNAIG
jgi:dTDP-4-amino-4,6-dideoxygalactose transaminase